MVEKKGPLTDPDAIHAHRRAVFLPLLERHNRIAICGGPRVGKSSIVALVKDRPVLGTDDYQGMPWEDIPAAMIARCAELGPRFVVEGVMSARALRKGLEVDCAVWIETPQVPRLPGQESMAKGVLTVFKEWRSGATIPIVLIQ